MYLVKTIGPSDDDITPESDISGEVIEFPNLAQAVRFLRLQGVRPAFYSWGDDPMDVWLTSRLLSDDQHTPVVTFDFGDEWTEVDRVTLLRALYPEQE